MQSRLRWHLHELAPEHVVPLRTLGRFHALDVVQQLLNDIDGPGGSHCD